MITCEYCKKETKKKYKGQKYCSYSCSNGAKKTKLEKRNCIHCGKEFEVHPNKDQKFCSCACSSASRKKPLVERTCLCCGEKFYRKRVQIREGTCIYCSRECRAKHTRTGKTKEGVFKEKRKCIYCGDEFEVYNTAKQKHCSRACSANRRWDMKKEQELIELSENFNIFYNDYIKELKRYELKSTTV